MSLASRHVSVRLENPYIEDVDTLARLMTPVGTKANRSVALRACVLIGLDVLKKQYVKPAEPPEPDKPAE